MHEYLEDFPGKEDVLRYVLCSIAPETKDSEFTWADFQARNNGELVAIYGNFINRALVLTQKYYDGKIPAIDTKIKEYDSIEIQLNDLIKSVNKKLSQFQFRDAQNEVMAIARLGNKFLADTEPWKLIKTDEEKVKVILNIALQIAANLSIAFKPFLPFSSEKLQNMLNIKELSWHNLGRMDLMADNHSINEVSLLFEKIEDQTVVEQIEKLNNKKAEKMKENKSIPASKEIIQFEDFTKMDIRVGTILAAEKVAKTKKLLKLTVDLGFEKRTIISGIAETYQAENIIGQQVSVLINLAPRNIKGVESNGMILMSENEEGVLSFIQPDKLNSNGSSIQ